MVAEVLAYGILKRDKVAVIAVYKLFEGLCILLIFNKGFVHGNKGVLVESVVEIIIMELFKIRLCFGKVLFTPFRNKCVGVVRRSNIYGGKVAYHKSIVCTDCGNGINTGNGRLVVFVVHNRNGVITRLCKYIVDGSPCVCGKYGFLPVLRNLVLLGRFADEESKSLCVQLFVKVGGICGFCACLNGNAVAHLCVLGYGVNADKTDALFNAFGLCCDAKAPCGGVIAAAVFISGVLRSNTGKNYPISVMELIAADIGVVSVITHHSGGNINAVHEQGIKRLVAEGAGFPTGKSFFYLCSIGSKGISGASACVKRIPNGGSAGFKVHCGVVITVGACGCNAVTEVHIFNILKAYGYINRAYKRIEFFRKCLHVLLKVPEHIHFTGASVFFVEHKVNIGFKVVPCADKRLPGIGGIVAFGIFFGVIKLKELFRLVLVLLVIFKSLFVCAAFNKVLSCRKAFGADLVDFSLFFCGVGLASDCALRIECVNRLECLEIRRNGYIGIF